MSVVKIQKLNEVYIKLICEKSIAMELSEKFSFLIPDAKYHPKVKNKIWDGIIKLINMRSQTVYAGLRTHVENYCKEIGYEVEHLSNFASESFSVFEAKEFIKTLNLPDGLEIRDYQLKTIIDCIREKRLVVLSATSSGKSLSIYIIVRYLVDILGYKIVVIVPNIGLVGQMKTDFQSYGLDIDQYVHEIYSGKEKNSNKPIIISTWQSLKNTSEEFIGSFGAVLVDETQGAKAKELSTILESMVDCEYRFGFTGTLDDTEINPLVIQGLLGPSKVYIKAKEMIERGFSPDITIKALILKYNKANCKLNAKNDYQQELDFILSHKERNDYIVKLALSLEGNVLILFDYTNKQNHGPSIRDSIKEKTNRPVFYIDGSVEGDERNDIRGFVENLNNAIIIASSKTTAVGTNIKKLDFLIFSSPSKAKIKLLQSIGRMMRKTETKLKAVIFDIVDDLSHNKKQNYALVHFSERLKHYMVEEHKVKIYNINLKEQ